MLKIMTSNIRFSSPHDGVNAWDMRKDMLSKVIKNFSPHILGTQEGREPQLRELHQLISDYSIVDHHRNWIEERMYPCLFINSVILDVMESGDIWLSETPHIPGSHSFESAFPRLCTWAKLTHKQLRQNFICINTHLDHVKTETRQKQIRVMMNEIRIKNLENLPLVFMGDFNESPFGETRKIMLNEMNLIDPWILKGLNEETTYHKFRGELSEKDGGARIDWIMLSNNFQVESIEIEKYQEEGRFPSDHFPVKAIIKKI